MRRTRIKVCGLRTAEAVCAAIDAGVDYLGFVFAESVRRVTPSQAAELVAPVAGTVGCVGVLKGPSDELAAQACAVPGLTAIQCDAADEPALLRTGCRLPRWTVHRLPAVDRLDLGEMSRSGDGRFGVTLLIEGPVSGVGQVVDWDAVARVSAGQRVILAGGLTPSNVGRAISIVRPFAVDVSSGVESAPGVKDPARIKDFVAAVRAADAEQR